MSTAQQMLEITDHLQALTVTNRQVVVVTGATGGIGEAIVKNLAPDYAVVAQGRDSRKLAKLSGLGQQVYPVRYDLSDTAAFAETFGRLPKVDALIKDRKSTRLNSSHVAISYAVFCLTETRATTMGSE